MLSSISCPHVHAAAGTPTGCSEVPVALNPPKVGGVLCKVPQPLCPFCHRKSTGSADPGQQRAQSTIARSVSALTALPSTPMPASPGPTSLRSVSVRTSPVTVNNFDRSRSNKVVGLAGTPDLRLLRRSVSPVIDVPTIFAVTKCEGSRTVSKATTDLDSKECTVNSPVSTQSPRSMRSGDSFTLMGSNSSINTEQDASWTPAMSDGGVAIGGAEGDGACPDSPAQALAQAIEACGDVFAQLRAALNPTQSTVDVRDWREELRAVADEAENVDLSEAPTSCLLRVRERLMRTLRSAHEYLPSGMEFSGRASMGKPRPAARDDLTQAITSVKAVCDQLQSALQQLLLQTDPRNGRLRERRLAELFAIVSAAPKVCDEGAPKLPHLQDVAHLREMIRLLDESVRCTPEALAEDVRDAARQRRRLHDAIQDRRGQIRVCCRVRRAEHEAKNCLKVLDEVTVQVPFAGEFKFNRVFTDETQEELFEDCRDLIQSAVDGRNVAIFSYGQTGSGKTYTMYGTRDDEGIALRAASEIFSVATGSIAVRISMVELYNNHLVDLLVPGGQCCRSPASSRTLTMRQDSAGVLRIEGLSDVSARDTEELKALMCSGLQRRATGAHAMNAKSSRSHFICTLKIESTCETTGATEQGKLVLCDLAGAERIKMTLADGSRQKEAIEINKSLSALGNVIEGVAKKQRVIPYRDHKLTQLLQDAIGGTAKTLMLVNVSPSARDLSQTTMSLAYAARARKIINNAACTTERSVAEGSTCVTKS
mmetsp:Transcript_15844/g.43360  ORF Transcript_15844/g.43360 Transcript_15844/m.43360 type:complete len:766 (+) Transcript_15844:68-2365(+)